MVESDRERRMAPGCRLLGLSTGAAHKVQIQDRFSGVSLSRLCSMSAEEVAALLGRVRVCPLCDGAGCAVRLGFTGEK